MIRMDKKQLLQGFTAICIALMLNLPAVFALSISHTPSEDVIVNRNTVRVEWESDQPATTNIEYGKTSSRGISDGSEDPRLIHSVILQDLDYATKYYYSLSADSGIETAKDDNSGNMYSFTTETETAPSEPPADDPGTDGGIPGVD